MVTVQAHKPTLYLNLSKVQNILHHILIRIVLFICFSLRPKFNWCYSNPLNLVYTFRHFAPMITYTFTKPLWKIPRSNQNIYVERMFLFVICNIIHLISVLLCPVSIGVIKTDCVMRFLYFSQIIRDICSKPKKYQDDDLLNIASLALSQLMMISSKFCFDNMQVSIVMALITHMCERMHARVHTYTELTFLFDYFFMYFIKYIIWKKCYVFIFK